MSESSRHEVSEKEKKKHLLCHSKSISNPILNANKTKKNVRTEVTIEQFDILLTIAF